MDLKKEFDNIVNKYGHKVIYRRFKTGVASQFVDPMSREGVGGERWEYEDSVILVRDNPTGVRGTKGGYQGTQIYYLQSHTNPKINDIIIEISGDNHPTVHDDAVLVSKHKMIFRIVDIDNKRGENGNIVFYTVFVKPEYGYY